MSRSRWWMGVAAAAVVWLMVGGVGFAQMMRYDGQKVVSVKVETQAQLDQLLTMTNDVWSESVGLGRVDVRVTPEQFAQLQASGLLFQVMIEDLQPLVDAQFAPGAGRDAFDAYMDLATVNAYLDTLVALEPTLAQTFILGQSIENRDIKGIRITGPGGRTKPGVLYHGGIHAREWITPPVALYVADQLIRNYNTDPNIHDLVDQIEWFIVPSLNVDGYNYTWTTNRMWRKNRRNNGGGIYGVDVNRNFGVGWGGQGSSGDPSNEVYRGTAPFSEPETQAVRNWIQNHTNIVAYYDLHSYAELIMYPYGYTSNLPPQPDLSEYMYLAQTQHDLVQQVHGVSYGYGPIYSTIYPVGGGSVDWVYDVGHDVHQTFAFTAELRDTGQYGFLLPPEQIRPNCEEMLPALLFFPSYMGTPAEVLTPNGGETWSVGQPHDITWYAHGGTITGVDLYYSINGGNTYSYTIATGQANDGAYTWTIPGTPSRHCRVKVVVQHSDGTTAEDVSNADFTITSQTPQVFFDQPLNTNPGWTVEGQWAFGQPTGGGGQHGYPDPTSGHTGTNVYGYNLSGDYTNNMPERNLTSTPIDCSNRTGVHLSFWRWLGVEQPAYDHAYVRVSNDGVNWTTAWQNPTEIADNSWVYQEFDISSMADNQPALRLRWTMGTTDGGWVYCGWNIDDIQLTSLYLPQYDVGDVNCDGAINAFDIDPFVLALTDPVGYLNAYPNCDASLADANGDGVVNAFDIDPFVALLIGP